MALFDENAPKTLQDVLGRSAETASMGVEDAYNQKRRRAIGAMGHGGRLRSGVSNYTLGDIDAQELGDIGGIQGGLAQSLGSIPTEDYLGDLDFNRQSDLARYIASLNKPSTLQEILGGVGAAGSVAGLGAAFL